MSIRGSTSRQPLLCGWLNKEKRNQSSLLGSDTTRRWFVIESINESSSSSIALSTTKVEQDVNSANERNISVSNKQLVTNVDMNGLALSYYKSPSSQTPSGWIFLSDIEDISTDINNTCITIRHPSRVYKLFTPDRKELKLWFNTLTSLCFNTNSETIAEKKLQDETTESKQKMPKLQPALAGSKSPLNHKRLSKTNSSESLLENRNVKDELGFLREVLGKKNPESSSKNNDEESSLTSNTDVVHNTYSSNYKEKLSSIEMTTRVISSEKEMMNKNNDSQLPFDENQQNDKSQNKFSTDVHVQSENEIISRLDGHGEREVFDKNTYRISQNRNFPTKNWQRQSIYVPAGDDDISVVSKRIGNAILHSGNDYITHSDQILEEDIDEAVIMEERKEIYDVNTKSPKGIMMVEEIVIDDDTDSEEDIRSKFYETEQRTQLVSPRIELQAKPCQYDSSLPTYQFSNDDSISIDDDGMKYKHHNEFNSDTSSSSFIHQDGRYHEWDDELSRDEIKILNVNSVLCSRSSVPKSHITEEYKNDAADCSFLPDDDFVNENWDSSSSGSHDNTSN